LHISGTNYSNKEEDGKGQKQFFSYLFKNFFSHFSFIFSLLFALFRTCSHVHLILDRSDEEIAKRVERIDRKTVGMGFRFSR